jgi:glutamate 5-kinase
MTIEKSSFKEVELMNLYQNRIVVKVGTSTLTNELGQNNLRAFDRLARVLSDIRNRGYEVILVSSGAIAVGSNKLHRGTRPTSLKYKQAAAAVGQCSIMFLYDKFFSDYDRTIAQILLNEEDIRDEEKRLNLTNTFDALLKMGVIPVVNENDSVSYAEIQSGERLFGDNDMLSAIVAVLCHASRLVILSDIDGFYDRDPRIDPTAKLIREITTIDERVYALAGGAGSRRGTGGMKTKLKAAELATSKGIDTLITNGNNPASLYEILDGGSVGTLFKGKKENARFAASAARKRPLRTAAPEAAAAVL